MADTPDSVFGACAPEAAIHLGRQLPGGSSGLPGNIGRAVRYLLDLAPDGVYRATPVARGTGALLPHRCTLTCGVLFGTEAPHCAPIGGLFSVALSCESPRLGVTQHPALRSPDVPRRSRATSRPPGQLITTTSLAHPRGCGPTMCVLVVRFVWDRGWGLGVGCWVCRDWGGPTMCVGDG